MQKDVEYLRSQGLMDYSMLVGIEVLKQRPKSFTQIHRMGSFNDTKGSKLDEINLTRSTMNPLELEVSSVASRNTMMV